MPGGAQYNHNIAGRALITYAAWESGSMSTRVPLGYSLDGVRVNVQQFERPIFGDQNGGQDGPPVDYLLHGEIATVSFVLIDYTAATLKTLRSLITTIYGQPPAPGTLVMGGVLGNDADNSIVLQIESANDPHSFPHAFWTNPWDFNLGTNETQQAMVFTCLVGDTLAADNTNDRILWSNTILQT